LLIKQQSDDAFGSKGRHECGVCLWRYDAYLKLPPASPATIVEEAANEQWADMDYALKENLKI